MELPPPQWYPYTMMSSEAYSGQVCCITNFDHIIGKSITQKIQIVSTILKKLRDLVINRKGVSACMYMLEMKQVPQPESMSQ